MIIRFTQILLITIIGWTSVFGQSNKEKGKGTISGKIINGSTKQVVEFATVSLFSISDSSLVTGMISNNEGAFELQGIANGNYYLKIDFIGLSPKLINNVLISDSNPKHNVGDVSLESFSKDMEQFEFVDEKELFETKIDKKIYNVSKDIGSQGGTGLEVLKNVPSVDVDDEDNISLRGDQSVQVLIDGRPSSIDASQLLKQIPASSIEKIEIVTNPSAKYNPEGISGILNVILKKEKASGFNGNLGLGYGYNDNHRGNGYLGLNFRKNKINIKTNVGYHKGTWSYSGVANRNYFSDTTYTQKMTDFGYNKNDNIWYSGGVDYYVNKKNTIYIEANGWTGKGTRHDNNYYDYYDAEKTLLSYSDRLGDTDSKYYGTDMNIGWQSEFGSEDHTLDVDIDYELNKNTSDNDNREDFYLFDQTVYQNPQAQYTRSLQRNNELDIKIDYVLPITDSLELELGSRTTIENIDNDFYSKSFDDFGNYAVDTNLNNVFLYEQNVYAFYATLGKQFKKVGVKVGTRVENTIINTELETTQEKGSQDYLSFFPSVHLSYKIQEGNEFQLSYSRRINRPSTWDVNPFASYTDPYNLRKGNPDLKPEYIDVYELSYLRFWDKVNFNSTAYFRQVNGQKQRITFLNEDNVFVTTPQNLSTTYISGGELTFGYRPYKWWRNNMTLNLWSANINNAGATNLASTTYGWSVQLTSNQTLGKGWSTQLRGRYNGRQSDVQGVRAARYNVDISISKQVMKKKGRITLRASDIFNTRRWAFDSNDLGGFSYDTNRRWASQSINISFNYSFGKMNYDSQKRVSKNKSSGDNLNTGGDGGGQGQ